jgi:hypothetical protein
MGGAAPGTTLAPSLVGVARVLGHRDYVVKVLLHGLTGEIDGVSYPGGVMAPMGTNTDEWIADAANFVRNSFGNSASFVTPAHVAGLRKASAPRTMWTLPELLANTPALLTNQADWKATASHNAEAAANGINGSGATRWDSGVAQGPGMWFQIELPQPTRITEVVIDSSVGGRGGFGGRWHHLEQTGRRRRGPRQPHGDRVHAGRGPVRSHHADGDDPAAVTGPAGVGRSAGTHLPRRFVAHFPDV